MPFSPCSRRKVLTVVMYPARTRPLIPGNVAAITASGPAGPNVFQIDPSETSPAFARASFVDSGLASCSITTDRSHLHRGVRAGQSHDLQQGQSTKVAEWQSGRVARDKTLSAKSKRRREASRVQLSRVTSPQLSRSPPSFAQFTRPVRSREPACPRPDWQDRSSPRAIAHDVLRPDGLVFDLCSPCDTGSGGESGNLRKTHPAHLNTMRLRPSHHGLRPGYKPGPPEGLSR